MSTEKYLLPNEKKRLTEGLLNPRQTSEIKKVAEEIAKKLGGKVVKSKEKFPSYVKLSDKLKSISFDIIDIKNQDIFKKKFDPKQTIVKIKIVTNEVFFPAMDMIPYFSNSGALGHDVIKTAKDAFEAFKDMS